MIEYLYNRHNIVTIWKGNPNWWNIFENMWGVYKYTERKSKRFRHFLGFLALTTLPLCLSITAYVTIIDFTGYRHKETTVPAVT